MLRNVLVVALAVCIMVPSIGMGKDMTGRFGLGYFHNDAPVGFRYWVNDKVGVDFSVGFESQSVWMQSGNDWSKESALSFWVDAGVPYVVFPSDRANFFVRPGVTFASLDDRVYGYYGLDATWTRISITATVGAEVFFGDNFSLEAGHGIAIDMCTIPDEDGVQGDMRGETEINIRTFDASVTYLGFHFYFD